MMTCKSFLPTIYGSAFVEPVPSETYNGIVNAKVMQPVFSGDNKYELEGYYEVAEHIDTQENAQIFCDALNAARPPKEIDPKLFKNKEARFAYYGKDYKNAE